MLFSRKKVLIHGLFLFLFPVSAGLFLSSCGEEESKVVILVDDNGAEVLNPGETALFEIHAFSNDGLVDRLSIRSNDVRQGDLALMDTLLNVPSCRFTYAYTAPELVDTTQVDLQFRAYAPDGSYSTTWAHLTVCGAEEILASLDNYTLYSGSSRNRDAFSLDLEQVVYSGSTDERFLDLVDMGNDSLTGEFLRTWSSRTALSFSRFNDFNYETATRRSVEEAYQVAAKYSELRDIQDDDIVLLGRSDTALGVLKVVAVFDEEGVESDRYLFSLKKL